MKKIFTLLLASGISASMFSQVAPPIQETGPGLTNTKAKTYSKHHLNANSRAIESRWLCYAEAADMMNGGISVSNRNYLFYDSIPFAEFSGGTYDRPWVNSIGNILDVSSFIWDASGYAPGHMWTKGTQYVVDSMSIRHLYLRTNPDPTVVDTLIVIVYPNTNNVGTYSYAAPYASTNFPGGATATDPLFYKQQFFNNTTGMPASNLTTLAPIVGGKTIKIPLTILDTADWFWGDLDFEIPGGLSITSTTAAARQAISTFTFKPGVAYTLNDTIGGQKINQFNFNSYEENGTNTYPSYWGPTPTSATVDWNMSTLIRTQERYSLAGASTNKYLPSVGFTQPFALEQHVISYKVTSTSVGINEDTQINGVKLGQNQPNPFNGNTVISYEIATSENVSLDIFDIAGKKIVSLNQGKKTAGVHSIELSSQNLPQGVYFYTLNVGDQNVTKKMTVLE
ncbi:MAG: T9SS type A sorting domain-containing protein [Bacteroidota bacterium]